MSVVARVLKIRSGEGRIAGLLVSLAFVTLASMSIGESGIDALFFERIGAHALPLMYLLQGASTFVAMLALTGVMARLGRRRGYVLAPLFLATVALAERIVLAGHPSWIYWVMWVTAAIATLVQSVFLWGTAGAVTDTRQAKRLFPIFAGGGILGAVVGGLVTRPLAQAIGSENLLVVWAAGLGVAFVLCRMALGRPAGSRSARHVARRRVSPLREIAQGFGFVRRSRLLVWMAIAATLFSILFFSLYLPYARAATDHFADADRLAGFFGLFWAGTTGGAFLVSMLVTNRLFGWLGVAAMIVVLPLMYAGAFGILLVNSGFVTLVALRFAILVCLQGVASPAWETLTNVIPASERDRTRLFLNGGPTQAGTAIAGVVALVGQQALGPRQLAVIGLVVAGFTVVAAIGIRRSYAGALVAALRAGRPQVFEAPSLRDAPRPIARDAEAVRIVRDSLRSDDVHVRRMAYELLADGPDEGEADAFREGLRDGDAMVRLTAVRSARAGTPAERDALIERIDDDDPSVAAAASARAVGFMDGPRPAARLRELLGHRDEAVRRTVVEQLAAAPAEQAAVIAASLLQDASAAVRAAALERLAAAAPNEALAPALAALRDPEPEVRAAAGRALGAAGDGAMGEILLALRDPRTADAAVEAIRHARAGVERELLREYVGSTTSRASDDATLAAAIPADSPSRALLRDAILDRGRRAARSALWALTLLVPDRAAMEAGIENLEGADPAHLANALETLEVAGPPEAVRPLLALWEPAKEVAAKAGDWLSETLEADDQFIRRCAELVRAEGKGGQMSGSSTNLSVMERVLFLRQVPLFAGLSPVDLERVGSIVEESGYADREVVAVEGEVGEELHIVVSGVIRVVQDRDGSEHELARRTAGAVVGEMSIISRKPRIASLIADGDVRTIRLGQREFESILRERPSVALAVMRELAQRLGERYGAGPEET